MYASKMCTISFGSSSTSSLPLRTFTISLSTTTIISSSYKESQSKMTCDWSTYLRHPFVKWKRILLSVHQRWRFGAHIPCKMVGSTLLQSNIKEFCYLYTDVDALMYPFFTRGRGPCPIKKKKHEPFSCENVCMCSKT